ncbi:MAG: serine/threonine protein kinase [Defluviitaleaceae bacterium]|nr:serine/threonine protein kinase [Defluviitaleaceae bacterium]
MPNIRDYEPLFDGWKIQKLLGRGSYGEVFKISREILEITQYSAVKQISISDLELRKNPKLLIRVKAEIRSMLEMSESPYIVRIQDFAIKDWIYDGGKDILIRMELLTNLESIIDYGEKIMPIEEIRKLGIHICRILEICEEKNIIHRDIKPDNIFRSEMGYYKLGDFGIARVMVGGQASTYAGSGNYMAPEIFMRKKYDRRVDIYSLGITLYYLLNRNKLPFEGKDSESSLAKRMGGEKLPVPNGEGIPREFAKVVLKACAYDPNDRFESAALMREALEGRQQEPKRQEQQKSEMVIADHEKKISISSIYDYEPFFDVWETEGFLGKGTCGEVYKVSKEIMGITEYSAVKQISISDMELRKDRKLLIMIKAEIRSMLEMRESPHIVRIEEFTTEDWDYGGGQDILIRMELLKNLESIIDYGEKAMPIEEIRKLGIHICHILEICKENNVIHRDIKPANIFRSEMGNYKLGDFGIARVMFDRKNSAYVGTASFMAPEVFMRNKYDRRVDIYSLGITLYYLLNGNELPFEREELPFEGHDRSSFLRRVMDGEKLPMPTGEGIPQELARAVLKACEYNADDRFESATLMREALEQSQ